MPLLGALSANPLVDGSWYIETYPDVRNRHLSAARHYRLWGAAEGRDPNPYFDTDWYLARYPDVRRLGYDPLDHYLRHGGFEGRDPSPSFDSEWYLDAYPDVRASGLNPLLHFLRHGYREGRLPQRMVTTDLPAVPSGIAESQLRLRRLVGLFRRRPRVVPVRPVLAPTIPTLQSDEVAEAVALLSASTTELSQVGIAWASADDLDTPAAQRLESFPGPDGNQAPTLTSATAAIALLEWRRAGGMTHLVVTPSAQQWLRSLPAFSAHLQFFMPIGDTEHAIGFDLRERVATEKRSAGATLAVIRAEFRDRFLREPVFLDLWAGLDFAAVAPGVLATVPPIADEARLPYVDDSFDYVAVADAGPDLLSEARRIAKHGVLVVSADPSVQRWRISVETISSDHPASLPSVSIVIPTHNGDGFVARCLASLDETIPTHIQTEIVVVDDASVEPARSRLRELADGRRSARLVRLEQNTGFVGAINAGAAAAEGDLLVLLNDDTLTLDGWLSALIRAFRLRGDAGVVGGKLLYPDGTLQEAGGIVFADGSAANFGRRATDPDASAYSYLREVDYVSGALLATPLQLFRSVGGLDTAFGFGYYDDSDYSFRLRERGYRTYYQPESAVVHVEGGTAGVDLSAGPKRSQVANQYIFSRRWVAELQKQPQRPAVVTVAALEAVADRAGR